jgi:hypothetical protein
MYRVEYLNCPFGTRCASPTLNKLFSPLLRSLGSSYEYYCDVFKTIAEETAKEYVEMIQRIYEHIGYISTGLIAYVSVSPTSVSALLTAHVGRLVVHIPHLPPPTLKVSGSIGLQAERLAYPLASLHR